MSFDDRLEHRYQRNIILDGIFTLCSFGLWSLVVNHSQIEAINWIRKEQRYALWKVILFTLLTFGLYFFYFQYCKAKEIAQITQREETGEILIALLLTIFVLWWVYDIIFQDRLNDYLAKNGMPS